MAIGGRGAVLQRPTFRRRFVAAGADTTPPTATAIATVAKLSAVAGKDSTDITISTNEPFVEFDLRVVPSSASVHTAGTSIVTATVTSRTTHTITVSEATIVAATGGAGMFLIKAFTKDAAGNWSTV